MPGINYVTITEKDWSGGIDQLSPEGDIPQGFVEDALNATLGAGGEVAQRKGYETQAHVPLRVVEYRHSDGSPDTIRLTFDGAVDCLSARPGPVLVYGALRSATATDFGATPSARWYSTFTCNPSLNFVVSASPQTLGYPASTSGAASADMLVTMAEGLFPNLSNVARATDETLVYESDLSVTWQVNSVATAFSGYAYNQPADYAQYFAIAAFVPVGATRQVTITSATHGFAQTDVLVQVFKRRAGAIRELFPAPGVTITNSNGNITASWPTAAVEAPYVGVHVVLSRADSTLASTFNVAASAVGTASLTGLDSPFVLSQAWLELTAGVRTQVPLLTRSVNASTRAASISFTNPVASLVSARVLSTPVVLRVPFIDVPAAVDAVGSFSADPGTELSVWGIPHAGRYASATDSRAGWVTATDVYRAEAEEHLCATLGWGLFREALRAAEGTAYKMPVRYPRLRNRAVTSVTVAPAFHGLADTVLRTRGGWRFTGGEEGWGTVTSLVYVSPGLVTVVVATPGRISLGGAPVQVEDTSGVADMLTLEQMPYSALNGRFAITATDTSSATQIVFTLRHATVIDADTNCTLQGRAGVFTDALNLDLATAGVTDNYRPALGDILTAPAFGDTVRLDVVGVRDDNSTRNVFVGAVQGTQTLAAGELCLFEHTGRRLGLRTAAQGTGLTTHEVVPGDVLSLLQADGSTLRRTVQCVIHAAALGVLTPAADGLSAALAVDNTVAYLAGDAVFLSRAGRYSGEWTVTSVGSFTVLTLKPASPVLAEALLTIKNSLGDVAVIAEGGQVQFALETAFADTADSALAASVDARMVAAENPRQEVAGVATTQPLQTKHFGVSAYTAQPLVRTTMSADSLFLANYEDPLLKFDGTSVVRAGLPRWQPGLFVLKRDVSLGVGLVAPADSTTAGTTSAGVFTCTTAAAAARFPAGSYAVSSGNATVPRTLTVRDSDPATGVVRFVDALQGTPTVLARTATLYRYYVRAAALDANSNILATACSQPADLSVGIVGTTAIALRLLGLPAFPQLDYDRLRLEVYRTKAGGLGSFFRVATLNPTLAIEPTFNGTTKRITAPYIDFIDAVPDAALLEGNQDPLTLTLTGGVLEPFTTVEPPPRSRFITTTGGVTAYANIRSWPRAALQLVPTGGVYAPAAESWVARKDSADTGTSTLSGSRVGLRLITDDLVGGVGRTITAITVNTDFVRVAWAGGSPLAYTPLIGQCVYLAHVDGSVAAPSVTFAGWWPIIAATTTTVDIRVRGIAAANYTPANEVTFAVFCDAASAALSHIPVWSGEDLNINTRTYQLPSGGAATVTDHLARQLYKVSLALNWSQSLLTTSATRTAWLSAFAGQSYGGTTLQLEFPVPSSTGALPEIETGILPTQAPTGYELFGNGVPRALASTTGAAELVRPSRVLLAYPNFPELVDAPFVADTVDSDSAVDVNPADGLEITALFPFFGESAFGAAQTSGVLVAAKANALYAIDTATRKVTRLETQGVGVSAPGSVAVTRQGIVFAHTSGLYRLTRNLTVEPVGAKLGRLWQNLVLRTPAALANMQAHSDADSRTYRFFFPTSAQSTSGQPRNTDAFAYNYTKEALENKPGSWTRLDNHPVTNFCNTNDASYFGTWDGRVMRLLKDERPESYRDDAGAIGMRVTFRSTDFGDPAVRKRVLHMLFEYRMPQAADGTGVELTGVVVSQAVNLVDDFRPLDNAVLVPSVRRDGISSRAPVKGLTVRYAPDVSKATQFQLRLSNSQLGAPVELVGISFRVVGLSSKGTVEAAQT